MTEFPVLGPEEQRVLGSLLEKQATVPASYPLTANALRTVACVGLMIDPRDVGKTLGSKDDADGPPRKDGAVGFDPTIFLYDNIPGGVGLSARLFDQRQELLWRAQRLLEACPCEDGCPACIGPAAGTLPGGVRAEPHPRKALGLEMDLVARGLGVRSQRYSMLVHDGVVKTLNIEEPGKFEVSSAEKLLEQTMKTMSFIP